MSVTVTAKPLIPSQYAQGTNVLEYTATNMRAIIDKFTATNVTGSGVVLSIYLVPDGQTAGNEYLIYSESIGANSTVDITDLKNHVLDTNGMIWVGAATASAVVIRCSGREVA